MAVELRRRVAVRTRHTRFRRRAIVAAHFWLSGLGRLGLGCGAIGAGFLALATWIEAGWLTLAGSECFFAGSPQCSRSWMQMPSMIPAATSVWRMQNCEPRVARREHGFQASREPTSAEKAIHFFIFVFSGTGTVVYSELRRACADFGVGMERP